MTFSQWNVIVIPFPFIDSLKTKPRPVLVISKNEYNQNNNSCIAAMITTASNTKWQGDTKITDLKKAGLNKESYIRLKLFTLDSRISNRAIGKISKRDINSFKDNFKQATF